MSLCTHIYCTYASFLVSVDAADELFERWRRPGDNVQRRDVRRSPVELQRRGDTWRLDASRCSGQEPISDVGRVQFPAAACRSALCARPTRRACHRRHRRRRRQAEPGRRFLRATARSAKRVLAIVILSVCPTRYQFKPRWVFTI